MSGQSKNKRTPGDDTGKPTVSTAGGVHQISNTVSSPADSDTSATQPEQADIDINVQLQQLADLRAIGVVTDEQYEAAKARILKR